MSLADNIQETFGLTPIEAMSSGLPVIVSDWNGYQDTVRHEIDGFRIPTIFSPRGCGLEFAANYQNESLNYSAYIAHTSFMSGVEVPACTEALVKLINNPELRRKMGENGRLRAREVYDWSVIIRSYENLWQELTEIRNKAEVSVPVKPGKSAVPLCDDPCHLFAHYPTQILNLNQRLKLGSMAPRGELEKLSRVWMTNFGTSKRLAPQIIERVIEAIANKGELSVEEIIRALGMTEPVTQIYLYRTLVYLLKFDVLQLVN
jgi:hypothetical protein